jgi:hypothetical protein
MAIGGSFQAVRQGERQDKVQALSSAHDVGDHEGIKKLGCRV